MATTHTRLRKHAFVPAGLALTALLATSVVLAVPTQAAPRPTVDEVQARVTQLEEQAGASNEKLNGLKAEVAATDRRIALVRERVAAQTAALAQVRGQLGVFAAAAYRSGGVDQTLQLLLSENPTDFLDQSASLDAVARGQQSAMRRAAAAQQQLDQSRAELNQTVEVQRKAAEEAAELLDGMNAKVAESRRLLNSLRADERARLQAATEARAAAAARASRAALRQVDTSPSRPSSSSSSSSSSSTPSYSGPASGRAAAAVAYARAQVGKRYVWGGGGPNSFDCSGLTMAAWAQAGVSLPHYTVAQYSATRKVSRSDMQPGDLIFFHADMHHMGIYIGGGMFVHAQNSATGVVVSPVAGHWSSRISGITRP